jgi:ribosome-interacting GTPase 1
MKTKVLELIGEKVKLTATGISIVQLANLTKLDSNQIKKILNELRYENKIVVKKGINNKMIYLK